MAGGERFDLGRQAGGLEFRHGSQAHGHFLDHAARMGTEQACETEAAAGSRRVMASPRSARRVIAPHSESAAKAATRRRPSAWRAGSGNCSSRRPRSLRGGHGDPFASDAPERAFPPPRPDRHERNARDDGGGEGCQKRAAEARAGFERVEHGPPSGAEIEGAPAPETAAGRSWGLGVGWPGVGGGLRQARPTAACARDGAARDAR